MGEQYTLADIDLVPFLDRFAEFYPDMLNATASAEARGLARAHARAPRGEGGVGDRRSPGEGRVAALPSGSTDDRSSEPMEDSGLRHACPPGAAPLVVSRAPRDRHAAHRARLAPDSNAPSSTSAAGPAAPSKPCPSATGASASTSPELAISTAHEPLSRTPSFAAVSCRATFTTCEDDAGVYLLMDVLEHIEDDKAVPAAHRRLCPPAESLPNHRSRASGPLVGARRHGRPLSPL